MTDLNTPSPEQAQPPPHSKTNGWLPLCTTCGGEPIHPVQANPDGDETVARHSSTHDKQWIVEEYGHTDYSDYPNWMPLKAGAYYATQQEAQKVRDGIVEERYRRAVQGREKDVRECAERAAVYEKATSAVQNMPQAHILGKGYRTEPIKEFLREDFTKTYRVAQVTSFQKRVQALLDSTPGESVDKDDLLACFDEETAHA